MVIRSTALPALRLARSALTLIFPAAALLLACARSELELVPLETSAQGGSEAAGAGTRSSGGGPAAGGRGGEAPHPGVGGRSAGGRAASGHAGEGGHAGSPETTRGGMSGQGGRGGSAGAAGSQGGARGGAAGAQAGMGGRAQPTELPRCDLALTPSLGGPPPLELANVPAAAVAGDFDGDGKLDLATTDVYGAVTVALGRGDGTFAPPSNYSAHLVATAPVRAFVAAADLDQNGTLDLVVSIDSPFLSILWGAGDGTFESSDAYAFYTNVTAVVLGDFDGDTIPDIVVATEPQTVDSELQFMRNNGHGVFDGALITQSSSNVRSLAAADVNEDGQLDLVSVSDDSVVIFVAEGAGTFGRSYQYDSSVYPAQVRTGDFDADGHVDLALPARCGMEPFPSASVQILLGHGDSSFGAGTSYRIEHCLHEVLLDHVNGDAALDVIASPTSVLLGTGDGSLAPELQSPDLGDDELLAAADFNGDGKVDIAVANGQWLAVHLGNGDGTFGSIVQAATASEPISVVLADFDRDGVLDVATTNQDPAAAASGNSVSVLRGAGDGTFPSHVDYLTAGPSTHLTSADLNDDGWLDLLLLENNDMLGVMLGTGNATFGPLANYDAGTKAVGFALGDLNGDGNWDAVFADRISTQLTRLFGNGDGTFAPAGPLAQSSAAVDVALLQLDADGNLDLASAGYPSGVSVSFGDGHGTFSAERTYPTDQSPLAVQGADLDGDDAIDVIVATGNSVSVRRGSANGELGPSTDYAVQGSYLTLVDFNQDGHLDVVANNPGLTVMLGAGDGTFTCVEEFAPGVTMTNARVGDVNRDGRLDVVTATRSGVDVLLNSARQ